MLRKVLFLTCAVSILLAWNVQAAVINSTWIGGAEGNWGNVGNWNSVTWPYNSGQDTYTVTIDGGTGTVVELDQYPYIDTLVCSGNVTLQMYSIVHDWTQISFSNPANAITNNGILMLTGRGDPDRSFGVFGNVTNSSGAMFHLRGVEINGYVTNETGAEIYMDGPTSVSIGVENYGLITIRDHTINIDGAHYGIDGTLYNSGKVMIYGGDCTIDILHNYEAGNIKGFGVIMTEDSILNNGKIEAYGGNLDIFTDGYLTNFGTLGNIPLSSLYIKAVEDVNNVGTIEVLAGGGVAIDANFINEPSGEIEMMGGTLASPSITQRAGATFEGFGNITTGNITLDLNSLIKLTGPTNIVADVTISTGATLEIKDGQTLITGHTTNDGTIHLIGGTVIFQGGYSGTGSIINDAGIDRNHFDVNNNGIVNIEDLASLAASWLWQASWSDE